MAVVAGAVLDAEAAEAPTGDALAAALEANRQLARLAGELREENALLRAENTGQAAELERLRERDAERDAEMEQLRADLAVLQRLVFGRSCAAAQQARRLFLTATALPLPPRIPGPASASWPPARPGR